MIIILVDKLANSPFRRLRRDDLGIVVRSVGQYPGSFEGLRVSEVHATEEATRHRQFEKVAATLAINMAKGA